MFDLLWLILDQHLLLSFCRFDKGHQQLGQKEKIDLQKELITLVFRYDSLLIFKIENFINLLFMVKFSNIKQFQMTLFCWPPNLKWKQKFELQTENVRLEQEI